MTVAQLLQQASATLQPTSETPQLDAQLLLAHLLDKPRSWLYAHDRDRIPATIQQAFLHLVHRRAQGEPVAYLIGEQDFYGLRFKVTPDVLIPRPETELLVDLSLKLAENSLFSRQKPNVHAGEKTGFENFGGTPVRAVDLGTGSGAIAIALKVQRPAWHLAACDLSPAALAVATENAHRHGVKIDLRQGCWLNPFSEERFHLIVSNPPYIDPEDPHLSGSIRFEPHKALVADNRGLADLAAIIQQAPEHLYPGGWLLLEHGFDQQSAVQTLLRQRGFDKVATYHDLAGQPRVSIGQWHT